MVGYVIVPWRVPRLVYGILIDICSKFVSCIYIYNTNVQGDHQTVRHIDVQLCHNLSAPLGSSHAVTDNRTWDADISWYDEKGEGQSDDMEIWCGKYHHLFSNMISSTHLLRGFHWRATMKLNHETKICHPSLDVSANLVLCFLPCWSLLFARCWFQIFFIFIPNLGEDSHFDEHIFQRGWFNHQLVNVWP